MLKLFSISLMRGLSNMIASRVDLVYSFKTTRPICSSLADAFWVVDSSVSPSKPPQGGFAVSGSA